MDKGLQESKSRDWQLMRSYPINKTKQKRGYNFQTEFGVVEIENGLSYSTLRT